MCVLLQVNLLIESIASSSEGTSPGVAVSWWPDRSVGLHAYSESSNNLMSVQVQQVKETRSRDIFKNKVAIAEKLILVVYAN